MEAELAAILRDMYNNSLEGGSVVMIHLFAIRHADQLRPNDVSAKNVIELSGIPDSYFAEVSKGIKFARFGREI